MSVPVKHIHFYGKYVGEIMGVFNILTASKKFKITYEFIGTQLKSDLDSKPDIVVTSNHSCPYTDAPEFHLGHGMGPISKIYHKSKEEFINDYVKRYYAINVFGNWYKKIYASMGFPEDKIIILGSPMSYYLLMEDDDRDMFLINQKLDPRKKTILYAPTWNQGSERGFFPLWYEDNEREKVEQFCCFIVNNLDCNLMVRMHESFRYTKNWLSLYSDIFNKYKVVRHYADQIPSNLPYLKYSNLLIGDMSGINTYFYIMDKPVVHIGSNIMSSKRDTGQGGWSLEDRAGFVSDEFAEMLSCIQESLNKPELFSEKRNNVVNKYIDHIGQDAADTVIKEFECL